MSINKAGIATAVALALSSCVALADGFHQEFQKGFYVGINTGASFVTGQAYSRVRNGFDFEGPFHDSRTTYRNEASARGFNGGLTLGWTFYCDREYVYSAEISGNLYSNRAYQNIWAEASHHEGGDDFGRRARNWEQSWDMTYSGEVVVKPGWFVSDSTQLYAIVGGSIAQVENRLTRLNQHHHDEVRQDFDHDNDRNHEDKKTIYGFVLGAGVQKQLCNRLSAYTSYEYTYYGRTSFNNDHDRRHHDEVTRQEGDEGREFDGIRDAKLRIDTNIFKIGLLYTF